MNPAWEGLRQIMHSDYPSIYNPGQSLCLNALNGSGRHKIVPDFFV
jgi:hypothetical protein